LFATVANRMVENGLIGIDKCTGVSFC
jgi:hypothetical protein